MTTNHRMQNLTEDTRTATGIAAKAVIAPREWTTEPGWVRPDNRTPNGVEEQTCGEPGASTDGSPDALTATTSNAPPALNKA